MAQQLVCDLCHEEEAVLMQTTLLDGSSMLVGPVCLPLFFGGAVLGVIGSEGHAGPPTKCKACRATHARMTGEVAPLTAQVSDPDNVAAAPEAPEETELAQ